MCAASVGKQPLSRRPEFLPSRKGALEKVLFGTRPHLASTTQRRLRMPNARVGACITGRRAMACDASARKPFAWQGRNP